MAVIFTVSNCGIEAFNADYKINGTHAGKPVYRSVQLCDGEHSFFWFTERQGWMMSRGSSPPGGGYYYRAASTDDTPPTSGWEYQNVADKKTSPVLRYCAEGVELTSDGVEHVLSLNEILLSDDRDKDVTFQCADGSISAHRCVMRAASDVLGRAFDHDFQERTTGVITVPDTTVQKMRIFLRVVYTGHMDPVDWDGQPGSVIPLDMLLGVSLIAKRYMVDRIHSMTTYALKNRLQQARDEKNVSAFVQIWAGAIASAMDPIRLLALHLAGSFPELRADYEARKIEHSVAFELKVLWPSDGPSKKRFRFE